MKGKLLCKHQHLPPLLLFSFVVVKEVESSVWFNFWREKICGVLNQRRLSALL